MLYIKYLVLLFLSVNHNVVDSLTLTSGQRIRSRIVRAKETDGGAVDGDIAVVGSNLSYSNEAKKFKSFFDLPSVEAWGAQQGLKEHHLKTLYRVIMNTPNPLAVSARNSPKIDFIPLEDRLMNAGFPKKATKELLSEFTYTCSVVKAEESANNGGCKLVIQLPNGQLIETVLIRHERHNDNIRYTVCVSSQVGCAKKCSFCATGTMGLQAQLTSGEILEQVFLVQQHLITMQASSSQSSSVGGQIRNVVYMGMGEPLDNYDEVHESLRGLTHQCLFGMKAKQITVSTVGASALRIRQLAEDAPQVCLALSLHSARQDSRLKLIPSAMGNDIQSLGQSLDYHATLTGRGAMLEYLLIDGVNDSEEEADALVEFCLKRDSTSATGGGKSPSVFVNLIPYNPTLAGDDFGYETPSDERIFAFHERLKEHGVKALIRWSSASGRDADGACGQLALSSLSATK